MSGWEAAKARMYDVFGHVPRPERVAGCPHCVEPGEERCLLSWPVASVEAGSLARYAAKALTTWGGVLEFRYFLPRLLECATADAFSYPDPEIVLGKLASADWRAWPEEERDAVTDFPVRVVGPNASPPSRPGPPIDTVLCALAATGMDLTSCLDAWSGLDTGRLDQAPARLRHDRLVGQAPDQRLLEPRQPRPRAGPHLAHRRPRRGGSGGRVRQGEPRRPARTAHRDSYRHHAAITRLKALKRSAGNGR
ncbi:hypothetical protein [Nonomuraea dietziae]|uniref:hypothetical protein n=1 Tax=Nonomuraea dietziae TaxID=65515 RepID=UPI0031CFC8BB